MGMRLPDMSKFEMFFMCSFIILGFLLIMLPLDLGWKFGLFLFLSALFILFTFFSAILFQWETSTISTGEKT
jgi:heme/copper-type cytochrome/quinol oxidase subunit 1